MISSTFTDEARPRRLPVGLGRWRALVQRYELNKARALLEEHGAEIPNLVPYDPAKNEKLPWDGDVAAAIEKLRAEKEGEKRKAD